MWAVYQQGYGFRGLYNTQKEAELRKIIICNGLCGISIFETDHYDKSIIDN